MIIVCMHAVCVCVDGWWLCPCLRGLIITYIHVPLLSGVAASLHGARAQRRIKDSAGTAFSLYIRNDFECTNKYLSILYPFFDPVFSELSNKFPFV